MNMIVHRVSPQQARYTPMGGREKCSRCRFYIAPKWCGHVTGPVSPMGWCKYFSQEMRQQFGGSQVVAIGPPGATLDLGFMSPGTLDPRITFIRASTATYTDGAGTLQTAAVDQPRWDYAGGVLRGLLIEDARTNLLLNSATLGTQGVVVTAQAYTLSFQGTGTITKSGAATGALVGTGAGQRVSQTFTPTAGTLTCTVTGSVTNAQLEAGSFPTSYIPVTAAAVTRAIDSCQISSGNMVPWFVSPGGSWFAEFDYFNPAPPDSRVVGQAEVANGIAPVYLSSGAASAGQYDGSTVVLTVNATAPNAITKVCSTWAVGQSKICANGGAVATSAALTTGYGLLAASGIKLMTVVAGVPQNCTSGHLRRLRYWPRVLSDAEMQQVTT